MAGSNAKAAGGHRRAWWLFGGVTLVVLVGLYVAGWFLTGNRVPNGTSVDGIDIGGLRPATASASLDTGLADDAAAPVEFSHDGETYRLVPGDAGLDIDIDATVREAGGGRSWNPLRMVDLLFGSGARVEPVVVVDEDELGAAVDEVAQQVGTAPAEPRVSFTADGTPQLTAPVVGRDVDEDAAVEAAKEAYLTASADGLQLPVRDVPPSVTPAEFRQAKRELIRPAVSGPVLLQLPGRTVSLPVSTFAPALTMSAADGELVASIDAEVLGDRLDDLNRRLGAQPRDATVVLRGGPPVVVPARTGVAFDPAQVADAILPVLPEQGDARSVEVGTTTAQADFTTAEARALRITEKVSSFVTYFPYAEYRNINQGRAAELIDQTVLKPGETFSFNDTVGERTVANGFVKGFIISNGVYAEELGGGVSQVVTTTYNAAFFAGLDDVEHKPHSFYIDRYPLGREATVAFPTVDLKFANSTPYGVLIHARVVPSSPTTEGEMHVEMYSTNYWDITAGVSEPYDYTSPDTRYDPTDTCVPNTGYSGFEVDVHRYFRRAGSPELVDKETDHVTYTPSDSVVCTGPPS
ncbi:MAG: VanW family protein [Nocardioidaceae bacterium]|nr:VanW family protein [Nocardioidaceae bacterium]